MYRYNVLKQCLDNRFIGHFHWTVISIDKWSRFTHLRFHTVMRYAVTFGSCAAFSQKYQLSTVWGLACWAHKALRNTSN